jgi:SAM-dependent methyltransferase
VPTEHDIHPAAATGFARAADAYERGRPGYPDEAIDWLTRHLGPQVIDLAAGTGKLSRMLAARGYDVLAVEPVAEMRALIGEGVLAVDGTAESIPAPDASAHTVTVGQAFHWFDGARALPEIHRVVRPGGTLVVIFNRRIDDELNQRLDAVLAPVRGDTPGQSLRDWRGPLEHAEHFELQTQRRFPNEQQLDGDGLVDRFGSVSFVAALDDDRREALLAQLRELAAGGSVTLRYRTEIEVYKRKD